MGQASVYKLEINFTSTAVSLPDKEHHLKETTKLGDLQVQNNISGMILISFVDRHIN